MLKFSCSVKDPSSLEGDLLFRILTLCDKISRLSGHKCLVSYTQQSHKYWMKFPSR